MFKGLAGLKKAVKGGFSVVAETSTQFAEQVVGDPSTSKENIKENIKKKVRAGCIAQRKNSCFPPSSPGFKSRLR